MCCCGKNLVPVYDSRHPFRDCLRGWGIIVLLSVTTLVVIAGGTALLITYYPIPNSIATTTTIFPQTDTLFSNGFLRQNEYLLSKNNKYCALMDGSGSLLVYTYNFGPVTAIWSSGSGGRPASQGPFFTSLLTYGNLVIYRAHSIAIWDSGTFGKGVEPHKLVMQNDGNLVIYDGRGAKQWSSI